MTESRVALEKNMKAERAPLGAFGSFFFFCFFSGLPSAFFDLPSAFAFFALGAGAFLAAGFSFFFSATFFSFFGGASCKKG